LGALYYWLPLLTGRAAVYRLSIPAFWLIFVGFNLTFFLMHLVGLLGMPRRIYTYPAVEGWTWLNLLSSVGGFIMTIGFALVVIDLIAQIRYGRRVRRDPWKARRSNGPCRSRRLPMPLPRSPVSTPGPTGLPPANLRLRWRAARAISDLRETAGRRRWAFTLHPGCRSN
jgi:Heme/copper-type cytochrome/quinol oxidases, subunit 1